MFAAWRDEDIAALGVDKSNSLKEAMTEEAELPLEEISRVTAAFAGGHRVSAGTCGSYR